MAERVSQVPRPMCGRMDISYRPELNRHEIDPPTHDTMRMPTLRSIVPQSKSLGLPLGPDPGAQYGKMVALVGTLQFGSKVSVVCPV
jgi:hypothetical protein